MRWSDRLIERVRNPPSEPASVALRSDADLDRFRFELQLVGPLFPVLLALWFEFDGRWETLPLFLLPLVGVIALHRFRLWRDRRKGRRDAGFPDWR